MFNIPAINICTEPFKNLNIDKIYGESAIAPCCIYPPIKTDVIDFYNNETLESIRAQWTAGNWPTGCQVCKDIEDAGHSTSRRQQELHSYVSGYYGESDFPLTTKLIKIDYWVGDTCNQACITCGPKYSSLWKQELKIAGAQNRQVVNTVWKNTDLSTVELIHFYGGETLLDRNHLDFLDSIEDLSNVSLVYNTNASVQPTQKMLETWRACKQVKLMLSIDDTEERFNYIRYPGNWNKVNENIDWMIANTSDNVVFGVIRVISILNKFYEGNVPAWADQKFTSRFSGVFNQPAFGPLGPDEDPEAAINQLDWNDRRRKSDWRQVFPRAAESLIPNKTAK
jgi:sulfatase maturation enzyme AslB (radical SAM superfamily)